MPNSKVLLCVLYLELQSDSMQLALISKMRLTTHDYGIWIPSGTATYALEREKERSREEKIFWDPAGNRTWTLHDTGDTGGPQTVLFYVVRHQPSMLPLGMGLTLTIQYTVHPSGTQWLRELMWCKRNEHVHSWGLSHSRKLGLVLW